MKKVALHTLGCKLNFAETSTIGNQFLKNNFEIVDYKDTADVYLFNTCTVTENAEKECRQLVRRVLRQNPDAFVIVTGCYAQLRPEEISKIEGVDLVLGSNEKFDVFNYYENHKKKNLACIHVSPTQNLNEFGAAHSTDADERTRAYFKIQDGCDYKCSFCTIPLARGSSRSMNPEKAIDEFKKLLDEGYKEIILTGVNVGDYGKSFNTDLYKLLTEFIKIDGEYRIRISSIEPNLLTDDILDLVNENEKMCNHFHIPLQSGSPEILKMMKRRYKVSYYHDLIHKAVDKIPDLGIGVDVIVGFPGETHNEFQSTYDFLRDLPISYLHVFTYSERPNTHAIELSNKVDVYERRKRNNMLKILSHKKKHEFYRKMIGKEMNVLFEGQNDDNLIKGFTSNYVRIAHNFDSSLINQFKTVKITDVKENICFSAIKENKNSIDLIAC